MLLSALSLLRRELCQLPLRDPLPEGLAGNGQNIGDAEADGERYEANRVLRSGYAIGRRRHSPFVAVPTVLDDRQLQANIQLADTMRSIQMDKFTKNIALASCMARSPVGPVECRAVLANLLLTALVAS